MTKPIIPFKMMPGSWGLKGNAFEEAKANYELVGYELKKRLLEIRHAEVPIVLQERLLELDLDHGKIGVEQFERALALIVFKDNTPALYKTTLGIDLKYGKITEYEYDKKLLETTDLKDDFVAKLSIELKHLKIDQYDYDVKIADHLATDANDRALKMLAVDLAHNRIPQYNYDVKVAELKFPEGVDRDIRLIEIELAHGNISDTQAAKDTATLLGQPWVGVVENSYDPDEGVNGFVMKLDWNALWIAELRANDYDGYDDDDVIAAWFNAVSNETETANLKVLTFPGDAE